MRMGQLALMGLVAMAISGSEIEIEGYQLGWSGGVTGFGQHAVLTPGGIVVVISCPGETKRVGFSARRPFVSRHSPEDEGSAMLGGGSLRLLSRGGARGGHRHRAKQGATA